MTAASTQWPYSHSPPAPQAASIVAAVQVALAGEPAAGAISTASMVMASVACSDEVVNSVAVSSAVGTRALSVMS